MRMIEILIQSFTNYKYINSCYVIYTPSGLSLDLDYGGKAIALVSALKVRSV